jgi:small-conductance mechanosensitive channel
MTKTHASAAPGPRRTLAGLAFALLAILLGPHSAEAADGPPIRIIIEVPNDEAGRAYVDEKLVPKLGAETKPAARGAPSTAPASDAMDMPMMAAEELTSLRQRAETLIDAVPNVGKDVADGFQTFMGMGNRLHLPFLFLAFAFFMGCGYAMRRAAFWATRGLLQKIFDAPGVTPLDRVKILGMRLSMSFFILTATLLGSIGAFLVFPWPPVFREALLSMLMVFLMYGVAVAFGRVVIAPGARFDYFRVLPISTPLAHFWFRALITLVLTGGISWAIVTLLGLIGVARTAREVIASGLFGVLVLMAIAVIWLRVNKPEEPPISRMIAVVLTAALVVEWVAFSLRIPVLFWTLGVVVAAPMAMGIIRMGVRNVVRADTLAGSQDQSSVLAWAVVVERTLRVIIVLGSASILAKAWGFDLGAIAMGETVLTRSLRSLLRIVVVLLVADLAWQLIRALIDGHLGGPQTSNAHQALVHDDTPEARRRQRLRTLLPILRNFLMVMIAAITILMVLDALGIQIGPLLAGAGVVGIAIGFGAQTLVKDIISGVFYLLDDAFRVGEYIQAGSHKGTVESFSLRSVKLRHHRGPITTVPFGDLGAVQNLSRDWVIDKITIGVTYDTDLDLAKKIVKQVGKELASDPEFAPNIIEPLKMQGVEQMGDFAIQLRLKMMTRPGEQFVIRRRAYALIKKAFAEKGIKFAFPTVQVADGHTGPAVAAAAQQALEMTHPPEAKPA